MPERGERKRIELASILALHPRLAILDEPDSGIDMLSTQDIINVINLFKQNAVTELTAKVFGHAPDEIKIKEKVVLMGNNARG